MKYYKFTLIYYRTVVLDCRLFLFFLTQFIEKLFEGCLDAPAAFVHVVFNILFRAEVSPSNYLGLVLDETSFGARIRNCQLPVSVREGLHLGRSE